MRTPVANSMDRFDYIDLWAGCCGLGRSFPSFGTSVCFDSSPWTRTRCDPVLSRKFPAGLILMSFDKTCSDGDARRPTCRPISLVAIPPYMAYHLIHCHITRNAFPKISDCGMSNIYNHKALNIRSWDRISTIYPETAGSLVDETM